jgi:nitrate reductase molybdenum cofactor assembly chaperone
MSSIDTAQATAGGVELPVGGERAALDSPIASRLVMLAPLLEYPEERLIGRVVDCQAALAGDCPDACSELGQFLAWLVSCEPGEAEEVYARTFLITPACAPYASVHLFGEESFRRAELMAGLRAAYERVGLASGSELPDHAALLLRLAGRVGSDELEELLVYCLRPALASMANRLGSTRNPYRHPLRALELLLGGGGPGGER